MANWYDKLKEEEARIAKEKATLSDKFRQDASAELADIITRLNAIAEIYPDLADAQFPKIRGWNDRARRKTKSRDESPADALAQPTAE